MKKYSKILTLLLCLTMAFSGVLMGCKDEKDTSSGGLDVVTSSDDGQWTGVHRP